MSAGYRILNDNRGVWLLVLLVGAVHAPLWVSDSVFWDDVTIKNQLDADDWQGTYQLFRDGGVPQIGLAHYGLSRLPGYVHAYKLVTFACILGCAVSLYRLARRSTALGDFEAMFIAALAMIYPFYSVWQGLIMLPYSVCLFLFLFAADAYARRLQNPALHSGWVLLAMLCFFVSFTVESLLVFFYGVFLYFYLLSDGNGSWRSIWSFVRRHAVALALPPLFFVVKRLAFPVAGQYAAYNQLKPSAFNLGKGLAVFPKRIVWDQLIDGARFVTNEPTFFLVLTAAFLPVVLIVGFAARRLTSQRLSGRTFVVALGYAVSLFLLSILAYCAVGKFAVINSYSARHALLAPIPLAVGLVVVLRYVIARDTAYRVAVLALVFSCGVLQIRNHVLWQNRFVKYQALIEKLKGREESLRPVVSFVDRADFGMTEALRGYELNWLLKQALENERHLGIDAGELKERGSDALAEALYQWNRKLYMFRDVPYPSREPFSFDEDITEVEIQRANRLSEPQIFVSYVLANAEGRRELARSLVKLELHDKRATYPLAPPPEWLGPK